MTDLNHSQHFVLSAVFTRDGHWVISGAKDRGIQFWNPITGDAALRIDAHTNSGKPIAVYRCDYCANEHGIKSVIRVDTSSAGNLFATAGGDKSLKIWRYVVRDKSTHSQLNTIGIHRLSRQHRWSR